MNITRCGDLYQLNAPGYIIRSVSKQACIDTLILCAINKVPENHYRPTIVTVDENQNAVIEIRPSDDLADTTNVLDYTTMRVKQLSDQLIAEMNNEQ
ncbi:MAG: hypothetical protein RKH07_12550 [Gammaproteobacteria bacterium]